ncbi:MAG: imidazoleglycerol-phosphate dehydratase [Gammaproteobacteria bacterium]|nr:MAG: imidazoleglycerol-phosphate dehydratase [Gammaproteobacteria bacterium]
MAERRASIARKTSETAIEITLDLDGSGKGEFRTGVPFFEHMLDQIARHGLFDIRVDCDGDTHIDDHHSVEDVGIALGAAFAEALGDRRGINRYGHAYVPLDEALSRVVIDFSGRPGLFFHADFRRDKVGTFDVDLVPEFFQGFANHARATLHLDLIRGVNDHHRIETLFKAFGRALRMACSIDERAAGAMPSTKGVL